MGNSFIDRENRKNVQSPAYWRSRKHEKETAKRLKGRQIVGSGCGPKKGDVYKKGVARIECKTTQNKSFSVTKEMVEKITSAAVASDELPVILVEFLDKNAKREMEVAVVPFDQLLLLLNEKA